MRSDEKNKASFKNVNLSSATVAGRAAMDGAIFGGSVIGQDLHAEGDVSLRNIYTDELFAMPFAQFGGNLDVGGSNLASLDLRGASIAGEMRLGGDQNSMVGWLGTMDLRNAHIGSLSDYQYSWPKRLLLDGVAFAHLGGSDGDFGVDNMAKRGADWWDRNFTRLPKDFTSSPYEQLAAVFAAAGTATLRTRSVTMSRSTPATKAVSWLW